ncbi:MAG: hypothetical protein HY323_08665 [Betaproteobacteria bacterium]|nr:hypothetical protein [Betaproteobacteria bacterium]MBI3937037.1 hypothetical protein [Betaproteobacteria bacterium]
MGAQGITVSRVDEIGDALKTVVAPGKPAVIDLLLKRELGEPFRRDAFRMPRRLLEKYQAHSAQ